MGYRERSTFDKPTAESVQRTRRTFVWIIPLVMIQQGFLLFKPGAEMSDQILGTVAWASVTVSLLWWLLGLPFRWLSARDQAILNDERSRADSGDAARWGIVALVVCGLVLVFARFWVRLDAGLAIYCLVNAALVATFGRLTWLNRAEPDEDE